MSKSSQHRKKKTFTKNRKGGHKIVHKLDHSTTIYERFIAVVLCMLMFLSFSVPTIFAFAQNLSPTVPKTPTEIAHQLLKDSLIKSIGFIKSDTQTITDSQEDVVETIPPEPVETEEVSNETGIPEVVYLHSRQSSIPYISSFPEVVEERISEDDVAVYLSQAFDSDTVYDCSAELEDVFCRIVERESGNQPFLGKLLVAEGVVSRVYSGAYGPSTMVNAILHQGYLAKEDNNGKLHIYNREGKEIISYSEDVQKAVRLALNGSRVSHTILEAVTEFQNAKYGLQLDDAYSNWGTIYHYNPAAVTEAHLRARSVRRAPVSFQFVDHVLYGYWLPVSQQLNL